MFDAATKPRFFTNFSRFFAAQGAAETNRYLEGKRSAGKERKTAEINRSRRALTVCVNRYPRPKQRTDKTFVLLLDAAPALLPPQCAVSVRARSAGRAGLSSYPGGSVPSGSGKSDSSRKIGFVQARRPCASFTTARTYIAPRPRRMRKSASRSDFAPSAGRAMS